LESVRTESERSDDKRVECSMKKSVRVRMTSVFEKPFIRASAPPYIPRFKPPFNG
jgi:hypothetical protein